MLDESAKGSQRSIEQPINSYFTFCSSKHAPYFESNLNRQPPQ